MIVVVIIMIIMMIMIIIIIIIIMIIMIMITIIIMISMIIIIIVVITIIIIIIIFKSFLLGLAHSAASSKRLQRSLAQTRFSFGCTIISTLLWPCDTHCRGSYSGAGTPHLGSFGPKKMFG